MLVVGGSQTGKSSLIRVLATPKHLRKEDPPEYEPTLHISTSGEKSNVFVAPSLAHHILYLWDTPPASANMEAIVEHFAKERQEGVAVLYDVVSVSSLSSVSGMIFCRRTERVSQSRNASMDRCCPKPRKTPFFSSRETNVIWREKDKFCFRFALEFQILLLCISMFKVTIEEGSSFAEENGMWFVEMSTLNDANVDEVS